MSKQKITFDKGDKISLKNPTRCYLMLDTNMVDIEPNYILTYSHGNESSCYFSVAFNKEVGGKGNAKNGDTIRISRDSFINLEHKKL